MRNERRCINSAVHRRFNRKIAMIHDRVSKAQYSKNILRSSESFCLGHIKLLPTIALSRVIVLADSWNIRRARLHQ